MKQCYFLFCKKEPARFYKLLPAKWGNTNRTRTKNIITYCEDHWKYIFASTPFEEIPKAIIIAMDIMER